MKYNRTRHVAVYVPELSTVVMTLMLLILLSACSYIKNDGTEKSQTLWRFQSQYIRIEDNEKALRNNVPNDHPVSLSASDVRSMLSSMQAKLPGQSTFLTGRKSIQVFNEDDLEDLGEVLSQGLAQASPYQDLVVFKAGYHRTGVATLPEKRGSTARVFYRDGKLNLIFGELLEPYEENADPRLNRLRQGSRDKPAQLSAEIIRTPGVELAEGRSDWVILNEAVQLPADTAGSSAVPAASTTVDAEEQNALRRRVDRLEKQLQEERQSNNTDPGTTSPVPGSRNNTERSSSEDSPAVTVETRLVILKHLLDQGLIPEAVYRKRVEQVLDEEL